MADFHVCKLVVVILTPQTSDFIKIQDFKDFPPKEKIMQKATEIHNLKPLQQHLYFGDE